jgi:hypothetical protein
VVIEGVVVACVEGVDDDVVVAVVAPPPWSWLPDVDDVAVFWLCSDVSEELLDAGDAGEEPPPPPPVEVEDGVDVAVLVVSRTLLHASLSVSVLTDEVAWFEKITFHEKWSVTADGVCDSSDDWKDPQNICASV